MSSMGTGKFQKVLIRLGERQVARLDALAEEHGLSRTAMLAMLLSEALERHERRLERAEERMEKMGISNPSAA